MLLSWKDINEKIIQLRKAYKGKDLIFELHKFFKTTNDGMIAFEIAKELEKIGNIKEAIEWCDKAESLFPKEEFKSQARKLKSKLISFLNNFTEKPNNIDNLKDCLDKFQPHESLLIVSCTKKKVWEFIPGAPDFVPARYAYWGGGFKKFLRQAEDEQIEKMGFCWIILSAKYGFIEPWHPIMRYDEKFADEKYYSISTESLCKQTMQKRQWRDNGGNIVEKRLIDFSKILTFNCTSDYITMIKICFDKKEIYQFNMKLTVL